MQWGSPSRGGIGRAAWQGIAPSSNLAGKKKNIGSTSVTWWDLGGAGRVCGWGELGQWMLGATASLFCCYYPLSALPPWKSSFLWVIVVLFSLEALPWDTLLVTPPYLGLWWTEGKCTHNGAQLEIPWAFYCSQAEYSAVTQGLIGFCCFLWLRKMALAAASALSSNKLPSLLDTKE